MIKNTAVTGSHQQLVLHYLHDLVASFSARLRTPNDGNRLYKNTLIVIIIIIIEEGKRKKGGEAC